MPCVQRLCLRSRSPFGPRGEACRSVGPCRFYVTRVLRFASSSIDVRRSSTCAKARQTQLTTPLVLARWSVLHWCHDRAHALADHRLHCIPSGGFMRKPRPATYNPAQALHLIASDRTGSPLSCPSCSGPIERSPAVFPPAPYSHVTLRCQTCGRLARYIAGAA
jgi:hypothetical protein